MKRAFVIEDTTLDVSRAGDFGDVTVLFKRGYPRPSLWESSYADVLVARLKEMTYDPDEDYIVLSGQMMALVVSVAAIVAAYGKFKALAFNAHNSVRDYEPITMGELSYAPGSEIAVR